MSPIGFFCHFTEQRLMCDAKESRESDPSHSCLKRGKKYASVSCHDRNQSLPTNDHGALELACSLKHTYTGEADLYVGKAAAKSTFVEKLAPNLQEYDKIVFATHGDLRTDRPGVTEPALILSTVPRGTDGFLRMTEVIGLKMNADLVALTACNTGSGDSLSGEGTMSMGRAFQYAGSRSVLMSLWPVEVEGSVRLVKSMFELMKAGQSKQAALMQARKCIRQAGYNHPFFWASFILVGESR